MTLGTPRGDSVRGAGEDPGDGIIPPAEILSVAALQEYHQLRYFHGLSGEDGGDIVPIHRGGSETCGFPRAGVGDRQCVLTEIDPAGTAWYAVGEGQLLFLGGEGIVSCNLLELQGGKIAIQRLRISAIVGTVFAVDFETGAGEVKRRGILRREDVCFSGAGARRRWSHTHS